MTALERDVLRWTRIVLLNAERSLGGYALPNDQAQERAECDAALLRHGLRLMRDKPRAAARMAGR
jgi:hypothetical protein